MTGLPLGFLVGMTALQAGAAGDSGAKPTLPVRAVTLFSSGVGFTVREGVVDGDALIPLTFRTAQINDILKSMVLLDAKGQVRPVVFGTKDPVGRTLQSFAVDVTQPMGRSELLNRLRGVRAEVRFERSGTETAQTGQVVGVESRSVPSPTVGQPGSTAEILTLLGDTGLVYVDLSTVRSIRLLDERLEREFRAALGLLASASDDRRRTVELRFDGTGKRSVRVGYVSEAPLWKVSYRLLVGGATLETGGVSGREAVDTKPWLQGWALVENTSDDDWKGVQLSLVSGRPVSFIQDLYQPLYVPRPVVAPDVAGAASPQLSEGALEIGGLSGERQDKAAPAMRGGFGGGAGPGGRAMSLPAPRPGMAAKAMESLRDEAESSVVADVRTEPVGDFFRYTVRTPVDLPRQQAAMIPIVTGNIVAQKLSVYNPEAFHATTPMLGVRVRNDTGLHLKAGPVTLFDDGVYAGDGRLPDMAPTDARLVTYAMDPSLRGEKQVGAGARVETGLSVRRGVLHRKQKEVVETVYTLRSTATVERTIWVEHPFDAGTQLVAPKEFAERTASHWRFAVAVGAGKSVALTVRQERPLLEEIALVNADTEFLRLQTTRKEGISATLKAALSDILQRRRRIQEIRDKVGLSEQQIAGLVQDQDRIRQNMNALDRGSALYMKYVAQLQEQEGRIQGLREQVIVWKEDLLEAEKALRSVLDGLTIGE